MTTSDLSWGFSQSRLERYREELRSYGLPADTIGEELLERMAVLDALTHVLVDERRAIILAKRIFAMSPDHGVTFPAETQALVMQGSLLTDIGKTGSPQATPLQQYITARIFSIDDPVNRDPSTVSFRTYLRECYGDEAGDDIFYQLYGCDRDIDIDAETPAVDLLTFREFIDKHTTWGLELLVRNHVPLRVAMTAMSHHFLESVNPHHILDDVGRFHLLGPQAPSIGVPEILIALLDKYDAVRTRSGANHDDAIEYLTEIVDGGQPRYRRMREHIDHLGLYERMRRMIDFIDRILKKSD